jgi:hypothetical protein
VAEGQNGGVPRPWTRRERERAENGVLSRGLIDIRTIAYRPEIAGDPAAALERIRVIADACHNLPGNARRHRQGSDPDPFAWAWQTVSPETREWLAEVFGSLGLDTAWLDAIPGGPCQLP